MDYSKLPGWRIEQKLNTKVLIGNWNEEQRKVCFFDIILPFGPLEFHCTF